MADLPVKTTQLPPEKIKAWGVVGLKKQQLAEQQEILGLELQKILLDADDNNITELEAALIAFRKKHKEMVELGQTFRSLINEKVLQQSLAIEAQYSPGSKTVAPYEEYKKKSDRLLALKLDQENKNKAAQNKAQEEANYKAHIRNQCEILAADFKQRALQEIFKMYKFYLDQKVKEPDVEAIKTTISQMKFSTPVKFEKKLLNEEEAKAINATVPKPNLKVLQDEMIKVLNDKFLTYQNDLAAGNKEQVDLFHQQEIQELKTQTEISVGINNLAAQAATPAASIVTEGKALKRSYEVKVEETEEWALKVMAAFIKYPMARQHIRARQWSNIALKQMAAALGAYATETNGAERDASLTYVENVK